MRSTNPDLGSSGVSASALYSDAQAAIGAFLGSAALDAAAAAAFGVTGSALAQAIGALQRKGWPALELVDEDVLHGARGAYDSAADTIYLSRQFLTTASSAAVTSVLVEEIGHAIDTRVNASDSAGDEGEIFAGFVLGDAPGADALAALHAQNDHGAIAINGGVAEVEFASTSTNGAKVGIVYSATTAARYWSQMAYSQLFMNAQSQAAMAGVPYDILTESDLTNTALLQQYDALIFPSMRNVQSSQVGAITDSLRAASQSGVGLIVSGEFLANNETGAAIGGDPYVRMAELLGVRPQTWSSGATGLTLTAGDLNGNVSHPMISDYTSGELIHTYSAAWWTAFQAVTPAAATVLATQTSGGVARPAVITTTGSGGGRNVHFSDDAILADHNLLWQAVDHAVNGPGISAGLQLSRNTSIVASRVDMDQAQETSDVSPASGPGTGIYDVLLPIVQQWKAAYNYVASYYVDIGNNPPGQQTDWSKSRPYYAELLRLGNELGSHSLTHPHNTNDLTPAQIQTEFELSRNIIQQQMSMIVDGAAVPGNPENLPTALEILQYYKYLSGGFSGVGAGYTNAFGYLNPAMAGADKVYLAPNVSFDFSLVEFQGRTADQAAAQWQQELAKLSKHADVPIFLWPWHDYGPTDWDYGATGDQSPYSTAMFTDFISRAYNAGAEFVTLDDLAERISAFDDSALAWSRPNATTVTATVTSANAGKLTLDLDNLAGQKIASVANWYAYDDDSVFLDRNGGSFTITLGTTATNVTRITALPMRAELVELEGDGNNLTFRLIGEGDVTIDLASLTGKTLAVSGATIQSQSGEILVLDVGAVGDHTVTVTLTSFTNSPPTITSNGGGATASISLAENTTAVTTVTATDPDAGQSRTFSISGGADAARFSINASTGVLAFLSAPDFEAPTDVGANNVYDVIVQVRDSAGATDSQAIAVQVTDAPGATITGTHAADTLVGTPEGDSMLGLSGDDTMSGGGGNDIIDGGTGGDSMVGGPGSDTYFIDNVWDGVLENANEGIDTVISAVNLRIGANIEHGSLIGAATTLIGNSGDNSLTGNDLANTIDGLAGGDTMMGRGGDDTYVIDNVWDSVIENAGGGNDLVISSVNLRLGANIENGALTGLARSLIGNELDNRLSGTSGADFLDGLAGQDLMIGGLGDDTYVIDNVWDGVLENPGEGNDTIISSVNLRLGANIENGTLSGLARSLIGNELDNRLTGTSGADVIDGLAGQDLMIGGAGDDTYFIDNVWDGVLENAGEGNDTVNSAVNLRLGANIENGTLIGPATTLFGNGVANRLIGNSLANLIDGAAGNDTMTGGGGADTFDFNALGQGVDTITDFTRGSGGDRLDLRDVLVGYTSTSVASNFVRLTEAGGSTTVAVNADGAGSDFVNVVVLQSTTGLLLNDMLAQGNLVLR